MKQVFEDQEQYEAIARSLCFGTGDKYVPGCRCKQIFLQLRLKQQS